MNSYEARANSASIVAATVDYERWLHKRIDVVEPDLKLKHEQMSSSLLAFAEYEGSWKGHLPLSSQ